MNAIQVKNAVNVIIIYPITNLNLTNLNLTLTLTLTKRKKRKKEIMKTSSFVF